MLTLELGKSKNIPLYQQIYQYIKQEVLTHRLKAGSRLPSKRALAAQLGISTITVENAYGQLMSEGYIYAKLKSGYYVSALENLAPPAPMASAVSQTAQCTAALKGTGIDLSSNSILPQSFPFSIWSRLLRRTMAEKQSLLLTKSPTAGILPLRQAIASHLMNFRGMPVSPAQIIVGAGTEYLYELLIKLIGRDKLYCVEDPGYQKLQHIYRDNGACCISLPIDHKGISVSALGSVACDVLHISPSHHFPTGIITPVSRRYELLAWAASEQRYIIEDDYDTEFRLVGKPIPSLFSIDMSSKVIYMNTFSKSLASTIRVSYMVLPQPLLEEFNRRFNYLSSTVSTFEQYTLASFIEQGYFERHINRMRNSYKKLRQLLLRALTSHPEHNRIEILQQASGLYFLLKIHTRLPDAALEDRLRQNGIHLQALQHFYQNRQAAPKHTFVVNYSSITPNDIQKVTDALFKSLK